MRIAIVSINYAPDQTGIAAYTTGLAEYLAAQGHAVRVHTGFPYYPTWRKPARDHGALYRRESLNGVTVSRSYLYVPAHPTPMKRVVHEASFAASALLGYLFAQRVDVTIVVSPPLPLGIPLLTAARFKRSRSILHVQDLQPDAAVNLGMLKAGALTRLLYAIERHTYAVADYVSSISHGMLEAIRRKGVSREKLVLFRNWAHNGAIRPLPRMTAYRSQWGLEDKFVVLYAGNLGVKQGLEMLLDAAERLAAHPDIAFVIVGDGGEKENLVQQAAARGLARMMFQPLQPFERLAELLATADVSVIPQKEGVRDIVLPSKLGNILASGRPVVVAAHGDSDLAHMMRSSAAGCCVEPGDSAAMAEALLALRGSPAERERLARNGLELMRSTLSEKAVLGQFAGFLEELARGGGVVAAPPSAAKAHAPPRNL